MDPPRKRLLLKFIIPYAIVVVSVFSTSGWFFYHSAQKALDTELSHRLRAISQIVSATLNPSYLTRIRPGSEGGILHSLLTAELKKAQEITKATNISVFDRENRVIVDARGETPIGQVHQLLKLDLAELEQVWNGTPVASTLYQGSDRRFYKSGYSPVRNEAGDIIAVVGVEAGADFVEVLRLVRQQTLLIVLLSTLVIFLIGVGISRSIVNPIKALASAIERVGRKEEYPRVEISRRDEIGFLAQRFNQMMDSLTEKDRLLQEMYNREKERAETLQGYSDYILEGIPTGVIGIDCKRKITTFNRAARQILETDELEVMGKEALSLLGKGSRLADLLAKALGEEKGNLREEFFITTPNGRRKWIGGAASPLIGREGRVIGATVIFSDLTEVKKLQDEITVKERLVALGELSAGIAHEIRNPLAAITGYVELLERKAVDEHSRMLAAEVVTEVKTLNRFVTDFLSFAREPRLRCEPSDLPSLIEGALALALQTEGEGKVSVVKEVQDPFPKISVDPVELRKALLNIILNAIQAMSRGGILGIGASVNGRWVTIRVTDTGPGIPEEIRDRIFNPFFTTKERGTGLGLSIAHKIIMAHSGRIECETAPDKGTCFIVTLPIEGPGE